jgi:hypothetical protein
MVSVGCTCGLGTSQVVVENGRSIEPVTLPGRDGRSYAFHAAGNTNCSGTPRTACLADWRPWRQRKIFASSSAVVGGAVYVDIPERSAVMRTERRRRNARLGPRRAHGTGDGRCYNDVSGCESRWPTAKGGVVAETQNHKV